MKTMRRVKRIVILLIVGLLLCGPVWADEKLTKASGTAASSGDNTLVAAPGAGNCLVLFFVQVQNESATSTTVLLKEGSTAIYRALLHSGDGAVLDVPITGAGAKLKMAPNTALVMNLSGANSHNYTVWYTVERMR